MDSPSRARARKLLAVVDLDNTRLAAHDVTESRLPRWLMDQLLEIGEVPLAVVFADFTVTTPQLARGLQTHGFTLMHCPKSPVRRNGVLKDTVDPVLIEFIHQQLELSPGLTALAIFSGDRDFVQVLSTWRKRGKEIVVLAGSGLSNAMRDIAHRVFTFRPPAAGTLVQPAVSSFLALLRRARDPNEYERLGDRAMLAIRDALAEYLRVFVQPMAENEHHRALTRDFLRSGLVSHPSQIHLWEIDVDAILDVLTDGVLTPKLNEQEEEVWVPNQDHPFVQYAAYRRVAA